MMLTEEQQKIVEDNHKLIYWQSKMWHLNIEDWYDLLAIELCLAVQKHDAERGALSNYYKKRCENLVYKEYAKSNLQKNTHNGIIALTDECHHRSIDDVEEMIELEQMFDVENGEILRMKANGYTQTEIAETLGVTQSYISKIIGRMKKEYYDK